MKRWSAFVLACVFFCITFLPMVSYGEIDSLPSEFWPLNEQYAKAVEENDVDNIIYYGEQVISLLNAYPETEQVKEVLASRYYKVADMYDLKNDFVKAGEYYEKYIPYGTYMNWTDGVKIAESKARQYKPVVQVYTDAVQSQAYFGAVNEPEAGVLYGQVSEHTQPDDSMILLYIDYGNLMSGWDKSIFDQARTRGVAVEVAWNIQGQGSALKDIPNDGQYVEAFLQELNAYSDVPVFLRIGAEMNIWGDKADPEEFKTAFRFLADKAHQLSPQVATVWSVSHASEFYTNMEDFYPGDEYVDWIGISAYMIRHFQGQEWPADQRFNEVLFSAGDAADPVYLIEEVMRKFGGRKPVMLAECGSAHTTVSLGTDNTDWAVNHLKRMYYYIPMVYPEVKLIAYFNQYVAPETNNYALSDNAALDAAYQELVKAPHFIQKEFDGKPQHTYRSLADGLELPQKEVSFYTYPHIFGEDQPQVRYYVDGQFVGEVSEIPYQINLDLSGYGAGQHTLRAEAVSGGAVQAFQEYPFSLTENIEVTVDGTPLQTDSVPKIVSDRVLVPMRTIFEALGAEVGWDGDTQTVTAQYEGTSILLTVGKNEMTINGRQEWLDVPVQLINGRTMVPVRAVSEALGAEVEWDSGARSVSVTTKG